MATRIDLRLGLAAALTSLALSSALAMVFHHRGAAAARHDARELALSAQLRARDARSAQGLRAAARERDLELLASGLVRSFGAPAPWEPLSLDDRRRLQRSLGSAVDDTLPGATLRGVQVITPDGSVIASVDRAAEPLGCPAVLVLRPLPLGRLKLTATFSQDCEALSHTVTTSPALAPSALWPLLSCLGVALGSFAAVFSLARGVARRIELLSLATARVGSGALDVRVRPRGNDDLDGLMRAFNLMVEELALTRARVDYLQRIAGWQEFARRLAHEIKNPLTPIQLSMQEVARKYNGDDPKFRRTLDTAREVVEEEIATLRRLVGAFSDFAKLPEVKTAPGDLAEFVRDAATSRAFLDEAAGEARRVRVNFDPGEGPIPVAIDRMMLRRAFENLVRNAVQAIEHRAKKARGEPREPSGTVWVKATKRPPREGAEDEGEQAWLLVEDDGPGIPPEHMSKVFDPYFTTKSEGTGLGLAIVRKIALDHDGDVGLEAREGGGARFVITLPLREHGRTPRLSFVTFSGRGVLAVDPLTPDTREKPSGT